jgi:hypothetical protein
MKKHLYIPKEVQERNDENRRQMLIPISMNVKNKKLGRLVSEVFHVSLMT